jgi:hypothetical protein
MSSEMESVEIKPVALDSTTYAFFPKSTAELATVIAGFDKKWVPKVLGHMAPALETGRYVGLVISHLNNKQEKFFRMPMIIDPNRWVSQPEGGVVWGLLTQPGSVQGWALAWRPIEPSLAALPSARNDAFAEMECRDEGWKAAALEISNTVSRPQAVERILADIRHAALH